MAWESEVEVVETDIDEEEFEETEVAEQPEQEIELSGFAKRFQGDVRALVKNYMEQFFKDKMLHCGGKIPQSLLFSERRISLVLNYDVARGVDRAYTYLEPFLTAEDEQIAKNSGEVTSDIKLVNETLKLLARSCIPQQFAGGMLLLYLEFVEGIDIGTHP